MTATIIELVVCEAARTSKFPCPGQRFLTKLPWPRCELSCLDQFRGARDAKIVAEEQNPVSINRQPSYAITADYRFYDQDYVVSILFANLGDTQLRARLVARKADFEALQRVFRGSLFTLHWARAEQHCPTARTERAFSRASGYRPQNSPLPATYCMYQRERM